MSNNPNFADQQIAADILTSQKYTTELYNKFALEAKMPKLHKDFVEILNQEHEIQEEMFKLMETKGWYPIEMAEQQKISEARKTFEN